MDLKQILLNKYLYIFFLIMFVAFDYVFGSKVFSGFGWLGLWTEKQNITLSQGYVRKSDVDDIAVGSVLAGIKMGKGEYNDYYYISSTVSETQRAGELVSTDVIQLLDGAPNKAAVLQSHISQIESTLDKLSNYTQTLMATINEKKQEAVLCENQKLQGDSTFYEGVTNNENDMIYEGLNTSMQNGPCYITNRIFSNAYTVLYNKAVYYHNILNAKHQILVTNQEEILQNYTLFRNAYLERLIALRNQLAAFNAVSTQ